jgi:hypothetical protein
MATTVSSLGQVYQYPPTAQVWAESLICIALIAAVVAIVWVVFR